MEGHSGVTELLECGAGAEVRETELTETWPHKEFILPLPLTGKANIPLQIFILHTGRVCKLSL